MRLKFSSNKNPTPVKKSPYIYSAVIWAVLSTGTLGLMSGCTTKNIIKNEAPANAQTQPSNKIELTADYIYKHLVAEVAGQRGDLGTSGVIFYELAKSEKDPWLAERAAKIAIYANIPELAIPAIKLWAELDPTSNEARQAITEMLIGRGKLNEAKPYLSQLLAKEETRAGGFLYLNSMLSKNPDKTKVLHLIQSLAEPYPDLAEAQFAIAHAAWVAGKDDLALTALDKTEALLPGWYPSALLKGQILARQSPQAAVDFYREFLSSQHDAVEIRINLAKLLVNQKQYAAAKIEYPIILDTIKNDAAKNVAEITTIIGLLSYQSADYTAANHHFRQALTLGSKDADQIYIYLGQTAEKLKQDAEAIDWYQKVPTGLYYLEANINIANVLARSQSVDKAVEWLDELENLSTEQQIGIIQIQAALLAKAKRNEEAFKLLGDAVKNMPNTPNLVYDYALAAERVQKFDILESELRRAIAEKPDFAAAYNALGYSFADRNIRLNEAVKLIEKALSLSPNDHYMLDSLGWVHYRKGNLDKALKYLQQAYDINPDPEIAAHLGEVLWLKGRHDDASKIWNDALSIHPDNEVLISTVNQFKR